MQDFKSKWVLVTGAASGIGRATALAFADAGASLILSDIQPERLEAVRCKVKSRVVPCHAFTADVADPEAMQRLAAQVHERVGALHVLINNAGIGYLGAFCDTPLQAWKRVLDINLMGAVHSCQAFLPKMVEAGGERRIVNIASLAGIAPAPNMSAYAASKFAVVGMSEGLSLELRLQGSEVGVSTVCPGIINTDITKARHNVAAAISDEQYARINAYYAAQGVDADVVGRAVVDGVRRKRALILVGPFARPMHHVRRISRALAQRLMLADARKAGFV